MDASSVMTGCDRPPSQTSVTSTALGGGDERKPATRADKIRMSNPPFDWYHFRYGGLRGFWVVGGCLRVQIALKVAFISFMNYLWW
jgi:hypothetical protein